MTAPDASAPRPAGLGRRLGALLYDSLLVVALLMGGTAAFLPLTGGEAISTATAGWLATVYRLAMLALVIGFFGVSWIRRGQTLGMAAWHLTLVRDDGARVTWADTCIRLAAACLSWVPAGLGFLWLLVDRDRLAWHDRLSRTRILFVPRAR